MKTSKKLQRQAAKLAEQINREYMKLDNKSPAFFDTYHDDLRVQMDSAYEEAMEVEVYENRGAGSMKYARTGIENLKATLIYMKAVIELQTLTNNLPRSVYG